ncbi:hypothetical protein J4457_03355 [Candidatus Woesearchaeota archaeon]|nr:hypothetical protein [Candidatus Woesearchaeota archaeon]
METTQNSQQQKVYLKPETILRFLSKEDEELDTLIMCNSTLMHLFTFDQSIYEAVGSMNEEERSKINLNKLTKFLEVVDVMSMRQELKKPRPILREEHVAELRKKAEESFIKGKEVKP